MKKNVLAMLLLMALSHGLSYGQQTDSEKNQQQVQYYKKTLSLTDKQAAQVAAVQDDYKTAVKKVVNNPNLPEGDKRKAVDKLLLEKNKKLNGLLTPQQLDDIVPMAERKRFKAEPEKTKLIVSRSDTTNHRDFMSKSLVIPQDKAQQVTLVMLKYKEEARQVMADNTLAEDPKRVKLSQLIKERNKKLNVLLTPAQANKIIPAAEQKL